MIELNEPWAMAPQHLEALVAQAKLAADLSPGDYPEPEAAGFGGAGAVDLEVRGGTAVVQVRGTIMRAVPRWFRYYGREATAVADVEAQLKAAEASPDVARVLLHVDSPGGTVGGILELGDLVHGLSKPVHAWVEDLGASAAYWIASQAKTVSAAPNSMVGSIGVYMAVADFSGMVNERGIKVHVIRSGELKGAGVVGAPITEPQLAAMQDVIDRLGDSFRAAVSRGRGLNAEQVGAVATGRVWLAQQARDLGLIDHVEGRARALERIQNTHQRRTKTMADHENSAPQAQQPAPTINLEQVRADARAEALREERERADAIRGAFAEDPGFAAEQIAKGASLLEAKAAHAEVLRERMAEQQAAHAKELEAARASSGQLSPRRGPAPIATGTSNLGPRVEGESFVDRAKALAAAEGTSVTAALSKLAREQPELYREFKRASYAQRRTIKQQAADVARAAVERAAY